MDYSETAQIAELKPRFKGLLTNLLAEAFYEEEFLDACLETNEEIESMFRKSTQLGNYINPFT